MRLLIDSRGSPAFHEMRLTCTRTLKSQAMLKVFLDRSSLLVTLLLVGTSQAQMHKVEKPERVTRAIGVYEWTGDLAKPSAARLIPVSLFMEGHFEDAGVYLARPVPFVLQTGDEYSIEEAGLHLGTLDVDYARNVVTRHSTSDSDEVGAWYGYGKFAPPSVAKPKPLHATAKPVTVDGVSASDDDQPHLAVRAGAQDTSDVPAAKSDGKPAKPTAASTPNPAPADDPDRPTLRHRDPVPEGKQKRLKPGGEVIPMNTSLNDDPDRPKLRRGVPTEELVPQQLSGLPMTLHQTAAVSDPANRDAHVFTREWETPHEHEVTLAAVQTLAKPLITTYLAANKLQAVDAKPAVSGPSFASKPVSTAKSATASARRSAAKTLSSPMSAFSLTSEVLTGYLLSYGGLPTFVYTAEVPVATGGPVYITMLVQRLPSGELQVALKSVTDATHMNRVPWMRPVDVVDPDASHRASILMELRAQSSRQFALYRIVTAQAEQTFVTGIIE
jgi:hypothetical protein